MKLIHSADGKQVYRIDDAEGNGIPIFHTLYIDGAYGPWIETHKVNPIENPEVLPDSQLHLDYCNRKLQIRFWRDGAMIAADSDDIDPTAIMPIFETKANPLTLAETTAYFQGIVELVESNQDVALESFLLKLKATNPADRKRLGELADELGQICHRPGMEGHDGIGMLITVIEDLTFLAKGA